jgi:hypothetical protein
MRLPRVHTAGSNDGTMRRAGIMSPPPPTLPEALTALVCPVCKHEVVQADDRWFCSGCGRRFEPGVPASPAVAVAEEGDPMRSPFAAVKTLLRRAVT